MLSMGAMSLHATSVSAGVSSSVFSVARPMRPSPLIATFAMLGFSCMIDFSS